MAAASTGSEMTGDSASNLGPKKLMAASKATTTPKANTRYAAVGIRFGLAADLPLVLARVPTCTVVGVRHAPLSITVNRLFRP